MKRFCFALLLCTMLFIAVPALGVQKVDMPMVVEGVIHNCDFFVQPWALWGYEDHYLYDVNRLNDKRVGVSLISPLGFEVKLVYDMIMTNVIYKYMFVPDKVRREVMRRESISVTDAVKLAKNSIKYKTK